MILDPVPLETTLRELSRASGAHALCLRTPRGARAFAVADGQVLGAEGLPPTASPSTARALVVVWLSEALEDGHTTATVEPRPPADPTPGLGPLAALVALAMERLQALATPAPVALEEEPEPPDLDERGPLPPELEELRLTAARCLEVNPLAVVDLPAAALHDVVGAEALLAALVRGAHRHRPERYRAAPAAARATAAALAELLQGAREALRDPGLLAAWLRELRRATPQLAEPGPAARATARGLCSRARALARDQRWVEALDAARAASTLDPTSPLPRVLAVCAQLALGLITPTDARVNLGGQPFTDPTSATRALRLARSLLRPVGFAEVPERCLRELDAPGGSPG